MTKIKILISIVLACLPFMTMQAQVFHQQQTQYAFRHVTTEEGLCNNEVKNLYYAPDGILWIQTETGWNSWDGHELTARVQDRDVPSLARKGKSYSIRKLPMPLPKTSTTNTILDVKEDGKGNPWIATDHQGVYIYNLNSAIL